MTREEKKARNKLIEELRILRVDTMQERNPQKRKEIRDNIYKLEVTLGYRSIDR